LHGRGLDNAGKTTIVKKIMNEDVNSVSPTLGFIIKTIEYDGYIYFLFRTEERLTDEDTN
jgi:GTPase SAR1 family protein